MYDKLWKKRLNAKTNSKQKIPTDNNISVSDTSVAMKINIKLGDNCCRKIKLIFKNTWVFSSVLLT